MTRVDFYIMDENTLTARHHFACKLIEKAYKNKHRIYIHTQDQKETHTLDELLWTYRDDSFLPHNIYGEGPQPAPPIQLGYLEKPHKHNDILLNLNLAIPEFYSAFSRILEIVINVPEIQQSAREHFKFYKQCGLQIHTHKLPLTEQQNSHG